MPIQAPYSWAAASHSQRGASHFRSGAPNQDAVLHRCGPAGLPAVLAVSDGHGSPRNFRSDVGSRLAVEHATQTAWEFVEGLADSPVVAIKDAAQQHLPCEIVRVWRQAVLDHYQQNPFPEDRPAPDKDSHIFAAYGATLLLVIIAESHVIYLQLGDGDILAVSDRTGQVETPIEPDPTLMANETTSLCLDKAQKLFRSKFQFVQDAPPALILAATDGYSNSFASDDDFHQVGTDVLQIVREQGLDYVQRELPAWLQKASEDGSGDDVTVGILCRQDLADSAGGDQTGPTEPPAAGPPQEAQDAPNAQSPDGEQKDE